MVAKSIAEMRSGQQKEVTTRFEGMQSQIIVQMDKLFEDVTTVKDDLTTVKSMVKQLVINEFHQLQQIGSVDDYLAEFEGLKSTVQSHCPMFAESHYITCFIRGLKPEIKSWVRLMHPETMTDALKVARCQECLLFSSQGRQPLKPSNIAQKVFDELPQSRKNVSPISACKVFDELSEPDPGESPHIDQVCGNVDKVQESDEEEDDSTTANDISFEKAENDDELLELEEESSYNGKMDLNNGAHEVFDKMTGLVPTSTLLLVTSGAFYNDFSTDGIATVPRVGWRPNEIEDSCGQKSSTDVPMNYKSLIHPFYEKCENARTLIECVPPVFDPDTSIIFKDIEAAGLKDKLPQPIILATTAEKSFSSKVGALKNVYQVVDKVLSPILVEQHDDMGNQLFPLKITLQLRRLDCDFIESTSVKQYLDKMPSTTFDELCIGKVFMFIFDPGGSAWYYRGCEDLWPNYDQQPCAFFDFWVDEGTKAEVQLGQTDPYSRNENSWVYSPYEEFKYGIYLANHGALFLSAPGGSYYRLRSWHWNSDLEICKEQQGHKMIWKEGKYLAFSFDPKMVWQHAVVQILELRDVKGAPIVILLLGELKLPKQHLSSTGYDAVTAIKLQNFVEDPGQVSWAKLVIGLKAWKFGGNMCKLEFPYSTQNVLTVATTLEQFILDHGLGYKNFVLQMVITLGSFVWDPGLGSNIFSSLTHILLYTSLGTRMILRGREEDDMERGKADGYDDTHKGRCIVDMRKSYKEHR